MDIRIATKEESGGRFGRPVPPNNPEPPQEIVYAEDIVNVRTFTVSDLERQVADLSRQRDSFQGMIDELNAKIASAQAVKPEEIK